MRRPEIPSSRRSYEHRFSGAESLKVPIRSSFGGFGFVLAIFVLMTTFSLGQIPNNGSFENDFAGWSPSGNQNIVSSPPYPVTDGVKAVSFNGGNGAANAVLTQSFATSVGQSYLLTFDLGVNSWQTTVEQRMQVTVQGNNALISETVSLFAQGSGSYYVPQSFTFVADSETTTLTFQDVSPSTINTDLLLDDVRVTSQDGPVITSQPQSVAVPAGDSATFDVTATGQPSLSYQWRLNGADIAGANASSYTINNVHTSDAGNYDVVVSNTSGSVTSATAVLTVVAAGIPTNGSFEYDYAGWGATGNQSIVTSPPYPVTDGAKAVSFNGGQSTPNAMLSQSFATTVGQSYVLTFDLGVNSWQSTVEQRMQVTVQGNNALISQTVSLFAQGTGSYYVARNFAFVADSETTVLTFQDVSPATINTDLLLDNVRVTVQDGPVITSQPQSTTAQIGGSITFDVTATGQAPLSYQWRFNGAGIGGANSSSYTINNVQNGDAGNYDVVVSNTSGSVTSATAVLTVVPAGIPANGSFEQDYAGWNATGNQNVASNPPFPVPDGIKLVEFNAGQTTPNGVLTQSFATTAGQSYVLTFDLGVSSYQSVLQQRMQITVQGSGSLLSQTVSLFGQGTSTFFVPQSFAFVANSSSTTLTFRDTSPATTNIDLLLDNVRVTEQGGGSQPTITSQPQSTTAQVGGSATFNVTATGQAPLSYQWRFNGGNIGGANSSSYTINNVQTTHAGNYDVVVSNSAGSATSTTAVLTVGSSGIPANGSFESNYANWTAAGNQAIATSDPSHPASDGSKVVVFNNNNMLANAVLSQTFATTPGQRYGLALDLGTVGAIADQRLQVTLTGSGTLFDQIVTVSSPDAGAFYVPQHISFVANSANTTLTFEDASITYYVIDLLVDHVQVSPENAQAPLITSQPQRAAAAVGRSATFNVAASSQGPLSYQWRFDGNPIGGATGSSYTTTSVDANDAGNYDVIVSNSSGSVTSSAATLTVLPPAILLNGSFEYGSAAWTFTGVVSTSTNINYGVTDGAQLTHFNFGQDSPNGILSQSFETTAGETYLLRFDFGPFAWQSTAEQRMRVTVQGNATLLSETVSAFAQGTGSWYTSRSFVFVADSSTTTLRFQDVSPTTINIDLLLDNVRVTLQNAPAIASQPQSTTVPVGGSATFSVTASGQAPLSYQWRFNASDIAGANSSSYAINNVQNGHAGNYDVVVSNSFDSVTSATAVLSVLPPGILANGSFEFNYSGWNATGNQQIISSPPYPVTDGVKAVAFNTSNNTANAVLTQNFATTVGQSYVLNFDLGVNSWQSTGEERMQLTVQGNSVLISQSRSLFGQGTGTYYQPQSFVFVADNTTTTLTFQDTSPATINIDLLLDNVRVTAQE